MHLVTAAYRSTGQLHLLGRVAFEVETERAPLGQHIEFALEVPGEVRRVGGHLTYEIVCPGHSISTVRRDGDFPARERSKDAPVSLTRQLADARLAKRSARPRGRFAE